MLVMNSDQSVTNVEQAVTIIAVTVVPTFSLTDQVVLNDDVAGMVRQQYGCVLFCFLCRSIRTDNTL